MQIKFHPFYNIKSEALKEMLGTKDSRTIAKRLVEIGAPIYRKGKNLYIITQEVIEALSGENKQHCVYTTKNPENDFFKS